MIGTPSRYYPASHSAYQSTATTEESNVNEGSDDEHHPPRSPSKSPIDDNKSYSPFISTSYTGSRNKEAKDYNWPSTNRPSSFSTYDDNDNITNAPLNLSLNGNDSLESDVIKHAIPQLLSVPNSTSVAQLILTSGQMVQGIQGAQLFVPTSQGLAKQIVLTIPITHVTTDQVINLSLRDGQIIPTTVGELLKLAMPKSIFEDDVTGEKIVNELMNMSEQTSLYIAEYLKSALKHSKKYYNNESQQKSESDTESVAEKDLREERSSPVDEKPDVRPSTQDSVHPNGSFRKPVRYANVRNGHDHLKSGSGSLTRRKAAPATAVIAEEIECKPSLPPKPHRSTKRVNDAVNYGDQRASKMLNNRQSNDFSRHLFASSEPMDRSLISAPMREEPTSTMNHEPDRNYKFDNTSYRREESSPTDSYDENDLDDIKEFAKSFKLRRLSMGLTQTQVGQALNIAEGPAYSQSAICSALASQVYAAQLASQQHSIFEKLDITPKSAQKIKPVLERWMKEAEERNRSGQGLLTEFIGMESSKKRKRRTSFTPQALEILNSHFEHNTHPSGAEITALAHQLGYDREVIRIWFCNKRQALKNTVRMMSKHVM